MFLKISESKEHTYLRIAESYRENGCVKQKTISNLGRLDKLKASDLENIISWTPVIMAQKSAACDAIVN